MSSGDRGKRDFFISHASEDKLDIVNDLAEVLSQSHAVWYDDDEIKIGDSIRRAIEAGLAQSEYGIVILSPHFFNKDWPQKELDVLIEKERLFPILHNITIEEVKQISPLLGAIKAEQSSTGARKLARLIVEAAGLPPKTVVLEDKIKRLRHEPPAFGDQMEWLITCLNILWSMLKPLEDEKTTSGFCLQASVVTAKILNDLLVDPALLIGLAKQKKYPLNVYIGSGPFQQYIYELNPTLHLPLSPFIAVEPLGPATVKLPIEEALKRNTLPGLYEGNEIISLEEFIFIMARPMPKQYAIIATNWGNEKVSGDRRVPLPAQYILDVGVAVWNLGAQFVRWSNEQNTDSNIGK